MRRGVGVGHCHIPCQASYTWPRDDCDTVCRFPSARCKALCAEIFSLLSAVLMMSFSIPCRCCSLPPPSFSSSSSANQSVEPTCVNFFSTVVAQMGFTKCRAYPQPDRDPYFLVWEAQAQCGHRGTNIQSPEWGAREASREARSRGHLSGLSMSCL